MGCSGFSVGIGLIHFRTAVCCHVLLQRSLGDGGIVVQRSCQSVDQGIGFKIPDPILVAVMVGAVGIVGGKAKSLQQVNGFLAVCLGVFLEAVEGNYFLSTVCILALVDGDVCHLEIRKLHALDCIPRERGVYGIILNTGGNVAVRCPDAIVFRAGHVVLVQGQRGVPASVDDGICFAGGRNAGNQGADHQGQAESQSGNALEIELFHIEFLH